MAASRTSAASEQTVTVGGHRLRITNLEKVLYPETGTTKADVFRYYAEIAPFLIPHARNRPATRKRWVHGVGTAEHPGQVFFQKNLDEGTPDWVRRVTIQHSDHTNDYPLVNNAATLAWLAQIAALEIHVPQWRVDAHGRRKNPDRFVIDLDPGEGTGLPECVEVAKLARVILRGMGLEPVPVTSGSKGIHLYAALDGKQTSDQVSAVAHELARALEADHPDLVVSDMKKTLRVGKVLVDWSQNNANKTTVCPYSLRGRFRPTVAVPRTWRELASRDLRQLELDEVLERMKRREDPLTESAEAPGALDAPGGVWHSNRAPDDQAEAHPEPPARAAATGGSDRLSTYRSKRDQAKTPEPVPQAAPAPSDGRSFVIQEHHARALHWDFRLEHDGVLVSWALPKGVPDDPKVNHLAVQTEDHPMEYGTFEGSIPAGEYGAGTVLIWDFGEYELEKWRDGEEIIVTLHGQPSGGLGDPRKVVLIHTGSGGNGKNWLIHKMMEKEAGGPDAPKAKRAAKAAPTKSTAKSAKPAEAGHGLSLAARSGKLSPMLATLGTEADIDDEAEWAFEMKWDGIRALVIIDDGAVTLRTRNGNDVTAGYPELTDALSRIFAGRSLVLDGEIVALDHRGRPSFGRLQQRMGLSKPRDVEAAAAKVKVDLMLFDILELDGASLVKKEYTERRAILADTAPESDGPVHLPPAFEGDLAHAMDSSRQLGLEGVMAKRRDGAYAVGRRSRTWIKLKHHLAQEVVIGGWRPGKGRRAAQVGSLLMGVPDDSGVLHYVGRVGTGFSDSDLDAVTAKLAKLARKTSPFDDVPSLDARDAHWVTPKLVGEVEFAEWTGSGQPGAERLRQPSWRGWRPDKSPADVRRE
ncbi:ATP-dependent DNA ligase [Herbiconiux ginsengi]|uniref:DNA ligase (ATP) n=1 Tax=Herbiconiux ginsengi TaxID=381665 RepID=A0A1H3N6N0_9MICO|nr:ATP-dependent DNA ligase [Herbiconiux ginsengi]SDY84125.1 ATP-dependent DNA ligase LigD ligase module /ATP-dependent DNA ligase LigD phosphoesterase module /ATP-dependent DNA ligase LigD polymerase module [Herbiconiux ginsengi]